jgi:hypothetical protein
MDTDAVVLTGRHSDWWLRWWPIRFGRRDVDDKLSAVVQLLYHTLDVHFAQDDVTHDEWPGRQVH